MFDTTDTILALASARQGGTRGIIRMSGPRAIDIAESLSAGPLGIAGRAPQSLDVEIGLGEGARKLPALLLVWPGTKSYTCQPTVEIHTVGSIPLLEMIIRQATRQGCRLAAPGEFTLRAFLAGRIDLTEAEAVLGVIDARGPAQLDVALSQLAGGMSRPLAALREELLMIVAELEAGLDFAEEDIEFLSTEVASRRIGELARQLEELSDQLRCRTHVGELPRVVLSGPPNAGKSSLFNALAARYGIDSGVTPVAAIVSPIPGATRDYLTAHLKVAGIDFELVDTAGEEHTHGPESLGETAQRMSQGVREEGTLVLRCSPQGMPANGGERGEVLLVATRCDESQSSPGSHGTIATSSVTGEGLETLALAIANRLAQHSLAGNMVPATATRCDESLRQAVGSVRHAHELARDGHSHELVVHELRHALDQIGQMAGVVATDDILDRVFKQFCIGK